jgi:hypothetical protein
MFRGRITAFLSIREKVLAQRICDPVDVINSHRTTEINGIRHGEHGRCHDAMPKKIRPLKWSNVGQGALSSF